MDFSCLEVISLIVLCIVCVFIMKKIQPELLWLYIGYLIFLWILVIAFALKGGEA